MVKFASKPPNWSKQLAVEVNEGRTVKARLTRESGSCILCGGKEHVAWHCEDADRRLSSEEYQIPPVVDEDEDDSPMENNDGTLTLILSLLQRNSADQPYNTALASHSTVATPPQVERSLEITSPAYSQHDDDMSFDSDESIRLSKKRKRKSSTKGSAKRRAGTEEALE